MSLAKDVIDALITDIDANAELAAHATVPYRRPRLILPDDCPCMVVWLEAKQATPVETESFESTLVIGISWHEESVEEVQTLIDDPEIALSLMSSIEKIEARARHLAKAGLGVDAAWELTPAATLYVGPEMEQGLTEGYALEVQVRVTES